MATPIPSNDACFTLAEVVALTAGKLLAAPASSPRAAVQLKGVCSDSRKLRQGELFVALRGEHFDAHDHLQAAYQAGAVAALIEREVALPPGLQAILVPSTLAAMGALARHHCRRWRQADPARRVVAITGSAGKTTTKLAVDAVLRASTEHGVHTSPGNLNNLIGVPMSLFGLDESHRYAVLELGTNAPGEIAQLAQLVEPDVAVVTLIALAHTEGLGSIEAVAQEKTSLFAALDSETGVAIGNLDDRRVGRALAKYGGRALGYGRQAGAVRGMTLEHTSIEGDLQALTVVGPKGEQLAVTTPLLGRAGALASAAAMAVAQVLLDDVGTSLEAATISGALAGVTNAGRLHLRHAAGGMLIIDDSYNANPASMRSSIAFSAQLASRRGRRLVLVLGEMRELGELSVSLHREIGSVAAEAPAALIIGVGGDARQLVDTAIEAGVKAVFAADAVEASAMARRQLKPDDVVLVKGSRGIRCERVVETLLGAPEDTADAQPGLAAATPSNAEPVAERRRGNGAR